MDEVHCLWALCPHPCCWEAERRIGQGVYRRAVGAQTKHRSKVEESLPSLTVLDVCEWAGARALGSDRPHLSRISCRDVRPRKGIAPRIHPLDPSFPAINPVAAKSQTRDNGTRDRGDDAAHISPLTGSPWTSGSFMLWATNPHHVPQCLKSSKSPHCAVKELICPLAARTQNTPKANRKGATKRVRFHYARSPSTFRAETVCPGRLEAGDASAAVDEPRGPGDPSAFLVKNKPVVFHSVREKRVRTASRDTPASLFKLDSKTGEEDVDWDSLRGQPYLWRRHNVPPQLGGPPGGTRGAREAVGSSSASKASSDQPPHSPQWFAPAAWPCVKRTSHYSRYTHPLLSHKKHHQGTGSELDLTIRSTFVINKPNQLHSMLDTDDRRRRDRSSKDTVAPLNSEFHRRHSPRELYANSNLSPDSSDLRIITGEMEPWGGRTSSEHLSTSFPSFNYL